MGRRNKSCGLPRCTVLKGVVCSLCLRSPALACNNVKDVPVLWAADCLPILLNFPQHADLEWFKQCLYVCTRMKRQVWVRCPAIVLAKQLAGKHPARNE